MSAERAGVFRKCTIVPISPPYRLVGAFRLAAGLASEVEMSIRIVAIAAFFAAAIAVTATYTSFAASSAAADASNFAIAHTMPNYMLRWDNQLLAPAVVAPVLGK
jgi:hypothetical protein